MTKRIYVVAGDVAKRLVEAGSQAQAVSHVVSGKYAATVAKPAELVDLMTAGVKVEKAGEE